MVSELQLGDLRVAVVRKKIRNLHLSVHPPDGHVKISAPVRLSPEAIRLFAISKIGWIRKQRTKILSQERETPREYKELETHWAWGGRCRLQQPVPGVSAAHGSEHLDRQTGRDTDGEAMEERRRLECEVGSVVDLQRRGVDPAPV